MGISIYCPGTCVAVSQYGVTTLKHPVSAAICAALDGFDRLTIQNGGTRLRVTLVFYVRPNGFAVKVYTILRQATLL